MWYVFPSPVTMLKPHEKKCQNYCVTTNDMVKCRCSQQEKMRNFDYREEYINGVISNKILLWQYYYGKKNIFSFSSDLQIHKKFNNVKEDPRRRKTDSDFNFS